MGAAILVAGIALLSLTGIILAACLKLPSFAAFGLAAYLIAWTVVVATSYGLSIGASLDRTNLLVALAAIAAGSLAVWLALRRPRPRVRPWLDTAGEILRDPTLVVLLAACAAAYAYTSAVALATAPNDGDPLAYELTRAAFWRQQHGVGAIHAAYDMRLDQSPPHAEMGQLVTMLLSGSDRFVAFGQLTAVFALTLGVAGSARRLGLPPRQAAYGALLVPLFPVVLVQSWTGFTDIVFAAFLVAAVFFALGSSQVELLPFGLAVGLMLGTKFLGPLLLPIVAVMVIVAQPVRRLGWFALVGAAGAAFGGIWYVTNAFRANETFGGGGGVGTSGFQTLSPGAVLGSLNLYVLEFIDVSGAIGSDSRLYAIVGLVLALAALAGLGGRLAGRPTARLLVAAGLLAALLATVAAAHGSSAWASAQATIVSDRRFFAIAAFLLVLAALEGRLTGKPIAWWLAAAGLLVALAPTVVERAHGSLTWVSGQVWNGFGSTSFASAVRVHPLQTASDGALSWFGPLGALFVFAAAPLSIVLVARGALRRPALVAGFAPLVAMALVSLTIVYAAYQGRYFTSGVALAAATWGAVARWRPMRAGIATVAIVTAALCLVNSLGKPSGVELLRGDAPPGVWGLPRWEQQGILRPTDPERDEVNTLRYVEENVPLDSVIGIALVENSFGFPYFGPHLTRRVVVVDDGDTIPSAIRWLVTAPGKAPLGCPAAWTPRRIGPFGWGVWERTGPDSRCATPTELVAPRPSSPAASARRHDTRPRG